jgi:hypothetical protein
MLSILALLAASASPSELLRYDQAQSLYDQGRVADARAVFAKIVVEEQASATDRAAAARAMARAAWMIDGDAAAAIADLRRAESFGSELCSTRLLESRILREARRPREALAVDTGVCATATQRDAAIGAAAAARLDALPQARASRRTALAQVARDLAGISPLGRLMPTGNGLRLEAAVLRKRPLDAMNAWRDFFWLTGDRDAPSALADLPIRAQFLAGARPGAAAGARCTLIESMVRAGFARAAERFMAAMPAARVAANPACGRARVYAHFRHALDAMLLNENRQIAQAQGDKPALGKLAGALGDGLTDLMTKTARELHGLVRELPGDGPIGTVTRAFNLGWSFGMTDGYPSAHIGHVIQDEDHPIAQYGRTAKIRFKVYDQMLANGFESWLWDGSAATGGWSGGSTIVQIRTGYTTSAIHAAAIVSDARERADASAKAETASRGDIATLTGRSDGTPIYLAGLADRLNLAALDRMAERVGNQDAADFPLRFAARYWDETIDHSIWAHEGRHAIDATDARTKDLGSAELEYRAKLAEILLGSDPRLAFGSINNSLIGTDSGHGVANTRIMAAYWHWIDVNRAAVAGFDPAVPAPAQLDKLTEAQFRAVAADLADFAHVP